MPKGLHVHTPTHRPLGQPDERQVIVLDPEQFARIEELLLPGYECAKLMLADIKRQQAEQERRAAEINAQAQAEFERQEAARKEQEEADKKAAAEKADADAARFHAEYAAKKAENDKAETLGAQVAKENAAAIEAIPAEPPTPPPTSPPQPESAPATDTPKA